MFDKIEESVAVLKIVISMGLNSFNIDLVPHWDLTRSHFKDHLDLIRGGGYERVLMVITFMSLALSLTESFISRSPVEGPCSNVKQTSN